MAAATGTLRAHEMAAKLAHDLEYWLAALTALKSGRMKDIYLVPLKELTMDLRKADRLAVHLVFLKVAMTAEKKDSPKVV